MWYVNELYKTVKEVVAVGFILTMWYVNINKNVFHLWYSLGFILTMWYVNTIPIATGATSPIGFILTMCFMTLFYHWKLYANYIKTLSLLIDISHHEWVYSFYLIY